MGNDVKKLGSRIGHAFQEYDKTPQENQQGVPFDHNRNIAEINDLNLLLEKNKHGLTFLLTVDPQSLKKNGNTFQRNLIRGQIQIEITNRKSIPTESKQQQIKNLQHPSENFYALSPQNQLSTKELEVQATKKQTLQKDTGKFQVNEKTKIKLPIILTLGQVYDIKRLITNYKNLQVDLQSKRKSAEGKICEICFDGKPEQALPCAHSYCAKCIDTYIVKNDKKCPICRKQYRESLQGNIYEIIEWDDENTSQMRTILLAILEKNNPREVTKIKKLVHRQSKSKIQEAIN